MLPAYRVWFPNDRSVVRDIKFLEESSSPLKVLERTKPEDTFFEFRETVPDEARFKDDDSIDSQRTLSDRVNVPEDLQELPGEEEVEPHDPPLEGVKRGRGAPRKVHTGRPGRSKKVYNMVPVEVENDENVLSKKFF